MNTRLLMIASSTAMALAGVAASFMPHELLGSLQISPLGITPVLVQILGAFYLAFAMINWMSKANLIGGIYNRPVAMGNMLHFFISALAISKAVMANQSVTILWIAAIVYSVFAVWFGLVLFSHPIKES